LSDVELKIRGLMAGRGLIDQSSLTPADIHSGVSLDLDTLTAYLGTLTEAANPNTKDRVLIERGKTIFQAQKCASCHSENEGIDGQQHDVGTGGKFDTPTLRWLWQSAPYLHDGSAPTLKDLFAKPGAHQLIHRLTSEEIDALVTYLLSL
jgi:cytochrome c peroxidase